MSRVLCEKQAWWLGPVQAPVVELVRQVGPEPGMSFPRATVDWEPRLSGIIESIKAGWDAPPVIAEYRDERLLICDGNHRFEAQRRIGRPSVWTIICFHDEASWRAFARPWAAEAPRLSGKAQPGHEQ